MDQVVHTITFGVGVYESVTLVGDWRKNGLKLGSPMPVSSPGIPGAVDQGRWTQHLLDTRSGARIRSGILPLAVD